MRRHTKTCLNDALLVRLGGTYSGVIRDVIEQTVRNRFTAQRELQPVIAFEDGHRVIPNMGTRRALIEMFGAHTEDWIGRRITISRSRVERVNRETGEISSTWQKVVQCPDVHARVVPIRREHSDYDDSPEALAAAGVSDLTVDEIFGKKVTR